MKGLDGPLDVRLRWSPGDVRPVGRLAHRARRLYFEYDPSFVAARLPLSPFHLPVKAGLYDGRDPTFDGLPGVFNDSLPDGWGRLLLDRQARQLGVRPGALGPLERLACVGDRGMGALTYHPAFEAPDAHGRIDLDALARHARTVLEGEAEHLLPELLRLGGSPGGARPKVLVARRPSDGHLVHGDVDPPADHEPWLVKFPALSDPVDVGAREEAYARMARAAGIDVQRSALLPAARGPGWFGTARFDRDGVHRRHVHTLSGLLHADHRVPALDYADALKATFLLTKDHRAVARLFRRAVFNVRAHNRDDHAKQFSFLMDRDGTWRLAPAYDLTFSDGPMGEHATLVAGEGRHPGTAHLLALAKGAGLRRSQATQIIDDVDAAIADWPRFAAAVGLSRRSTNEVARALPR